MVVRLGIAHWSSGYLAEAEQSLTEADHAAQQPGNQHARPTALSFLGTTERAWGKLHRAAELYWRAIRLGEQLPPIALAPNELSALLYEWNDLQADADRLQHRTALSERSAHVEGQIGGYRMLARTKQARGDAFAALDARCKAHELAHDSDVLPVTDPGNRACPTGMAPAQEDSATTIHWAEQATEYAVTSQLGVTV